MKCQVFETTIIELARGRMTEAAEREAALAHAHSCAACAGKLADERALTAGLRRFATASQTTQAPSSVESALRTAFREQVRIRAATPRGDGLRRKTWRRRALAAAAAAAILVAAGVVAWRLDQIPPGNELPRAGSSRPGEQPGTDQSPARPEQGNGPTIVRPVITEVPKNKNKGRTAGLRPYRAQRDRPANRSDRSDQEVEIATDFIPMSGADLMPLDGGVVVRVELPRTALISFGLPMNMERADERIKADVVVGNDGLARAIRFVH